MTQFGAINFARFYLYSSGVFGKDDSADNYQLHRSLQFYLCRAFQRLSDVFGEGEINKKDVAHIVEAWILSARNEYECIGWAENGWRRLPPLVAKNEAQPTATVISERCPNVHPSQITTSATFAVQNPTK